METTFEGDDVRLKCVFDSPQYGKIGCDIKIKDGVALAVFSDNRLAKDMYWAEKRLGIDDVYYKERLSAIATKYPGKSKEEIAKELIKKLEAHNVQVLGDKNEGN